ncbi:hypothetical protein Tco_0305550 [Tanacetum coccineum]
MNWGPLSMLIELHIVFLQDLRRGLDDDYCMNSHLSVGSSKSIALGWINEADVGESSVGKNDNVNVVGSSKSLALGWVNKADVDGNVHEEQTINVNDYTIDDMF